MTIYCDQCLKLATQTSHCQAVKDRILCLQQAALPLEKEKHTQKHPPPLPFSNTRGA